MQKKRFAHENLPPEYQRSADAMNLDEDKIPAYSLPALPFDKNTPVDEFEKIRPGLLEEFKRSMYGEIPPVCEAIELVVTDEGAAFDGLALRRSIDIICRHRGDEQILHLLLYIPQRRSGKVPVFFGLNFLGNVATDFDPEIPFFDFETMAPMWNFRYDDRRVKTDQRGVQAGRWCFRDVIERGFAAATIAYGDIYIDRPDGFDSSIMRFFYSAEEWQSPQRPSGAISAWSWGIMRALDCLEQQPEIDRSRFIVHGHSRLGKTALWAGANDPRIWLTVSNCSGAGGAKLSHRYYGEDFAWLNLWYGHWFCGKFAEYAGRDLQYPVDQHFLMAAIAPRLLYIASADLDVHADPEGEFLCGKAASAAWNIFGLKGLEDFNYPAAGCLIGNQQGYYLRQGGHDFTPENWQALLAFTEKHLNYKQE